MLDRAGLAPDLHHRLDLLLGDEADGRAPPEQPRDAQADRLEHEGDRLQNPAHGLNDRGDENGGAFGVARGDRLGNRLAENEEQRRDGGGRGGEREVLVGDEGDGDARAHGRRAGVDEVVAQEDGREEALRGFDHPLDALRARRALVDEASQPHALNREQGGFRP